MRVSVEVNLFPDQLLSCHTGLYLDTYCICVIRVINGQIKECMTLFTPHKISPFVQTNNQLIRYSTDKGDNNNCFWYY